MRSAYSTNAAPSMEEKQRLMQEAMGMGRPKKAAGKKAAGGCASLTFVFCRLCWLC